MIEQDRMPASGGSALGSSDDGVLLVGHGTRDPVGVAEFLKVAEDAARRLAPRPLEPCFLEIAEPTIATGFARLMERGARRATVVPLLLFAAGHAKRDIPALVAEAAARHGGMPVQHTSPLECHPQILELSARRFREAVDFADRAEPPPSRTGLSTRPGRLGRAVLQDTLLVMVGRGSSDAAAAAEMRRFSRLRRELTPVDGLETSFVAKQQPTLPATLEFAFRSGYGRIVVQPHLLFSGQLIGDIRREVERASGGRLGPGLPAVVDQAADGKQWVVAAPLGPEPELAAAIDDLAARADNAQLRRNRETAAGEFL